MKISFSNKMKRKILDCKKRNTANARREIRSSVNDFHARDGYIYIYTFQ